MEFDWEKYFKNVCECTQLLATSRQYEEVFDTVVYSIANIYKSSTCAIVLIDPATEYLNIVNNLGLSHTFCNEYRKRIATGEIGRLIWTGKPILITDSSLEPEISSEIKLEKTFSSCMCVPLTVDQRTIGFLYVDSEEKGKFTSKDLSVLKSFADLAAVAYFKYKIAEENIRLDTTDRETGAEKYNLFYDKLNQVFLTAEKKNDCFSIVLIDVDNIKSINKTYGHPSGLKLMKQLLEIIRRVRRDIYSIARYGFDEYIILLEGTPLDEAIQFAKLLKSNVNSMEFTDNKIHSSISVGVVSYPQNAITIEDLLIGVKNALFEAQRAGTNCICHFKRQWYLKDPLHIIK